MSLPALLNFCQLEPQFASKLDLQKIITFCDLIQLLRPCIEHLTPSYILQPPERLTIDIHAFLMDAVGLLHDECKLAWFYLRDIVWPIILGEREVTALRMKYIQVLLQHGLENEIGAFNLFPPTRTCIDPKCAKRLISESTNWRERELSEPRTMKITVFSKEFGSVPGFSTSYYCRLCHTRYYNNYYVHTSASYRTYYHGCPQFIQTSEHYFMDSKECERIVSMMCSAWTSGTNCARIFNSIPQEPDITASLPLNWQSRLELEVDDVWNGFFLHSLLKDNEERESVLTLPHQAPSQADRLRDALETRNSLMAGTGQEAWNHACDACCWVFEDENGQHCQLRSVVVDGITVGCPCCNVHDCTRPLQRAKDRYCSEHQELSTLCRVLGCTEKASEGFKTCAHGEHRAVELHATARGKAMFQLKARLQRLRTSQTHNSLNFSSDSQADEAGVEGLGTDFDEDYVLDTSGIHMADTVNDRTCNGKPDTGNVKLRARFGRRRTHCEVICTASCGVILGRATFFGSEAPNGIRNFLMCLFPTKTSLPGVIWYDNACQLLAMLHKDTDPHLRDYFSMCAMPVDVFHFKSKHKESDQFCGEHCNPAKWPQLQTSEGKWRFNSSAAEQTNVWFGVFASIVREMRIDRYTFFLDEMIKQRNRLLIQELERNEKALYIIPRSILLGM